MNVWSSKQADSEHRPSQTDEKGTQNQPPAKVAMANVG